MPSAYGPIEAALVSKFVSVFSVELNDGLVKAGKLDELIQNVLEDNADYGVLLEFNGGIEDSGRPFSRPVWIWETAGIFLIRYRDGDDIEIKLRDVVDKLAVLFDEDHTLGGTTPFAKFRVIEPSEPVQIGDLPFYWLPFVIAFHAR